MQRSFLLGAILTLLFLATGCPRNQYVIDLTPRGKVIERRLLVYREDGANSNGVPNYNQFPPVDLAAIAKLYPAGSLTNEGQRHTMIGNFSGNLPPDVGGAGSYTNIITTLGSAGFYLERFRGDDDVASRTAKRLHQADQFVDLIIGWSRMELGRERGYEKLRKFLDEDFRRDVKNLSLYAWMLQTSSAMRSDSPEEFGVRFGQYLAERGYIGADELPALFHAFFGGDSQPVMRVLQRLVATKLGVPRDRPIPPSLSFLSDWDTMTKSWEKYLVTTDLYRAYYRKWQKEKLIHDVKVAETRAQGFYNPAYRTNVVPAAPGKPEPEVVINDMMQDFVAINFFGTDDHVTVRLSLPSAPAHSNGKWDEAHKKVVWDSEIEQETGKDGRVPAFCYASWSEPDEAAQTKHFGSVLLRGDELTQYCLWRAGLTRNQAAEWDALLDTLQPNDSLKGSIASFHFSGETSKSPAINHQDLSRSSDFIRQLLNGALESADKTVVSK